MSVCKAVALFLALVAGRAASLCPVKQTEGTVCPRFNEIEIKFKPYYSKYFDKNGSTKSLYPRLLINASSQCCNSSEITFTAVNGTEDIEEMMTDESCRKDPADDLHLTFFFPVYTKGGAKFAFDDEFIFIQLAKSPGPAITMLKSEKGKMKVTASQAVRESWPLFVLIICLSATVGLLGWLLDHHSNPSQFSKWFYKGSWEGFWWAMVTITTVGYGDKVPVAFFARILTILWMFCGAIILSLFTANVTSVLTSNQMDNSKDLIGSTIAVLNSKHYFETSLNVGASIKEFNTEEEMFASLIGGDINHILTPTTDYTSYFDKEKGDLLAIVDVIPDPFLTGLALVNKETKSDKPFINCLKRKIKTMKSEIRSKDSVPSQEKGAMTTMLFEKDIVEIIYYNLIAIGVIAAIGVVLDVIKILRKTRQKSYGRSEEGRELRNRETNC